MKSLIVLVLLAVLFVNSTAIYLTNETRNVKIEENPAIWTEDDGIWGPLMEDFVIGNKRGSRVMMLPPDPNFYKFEEKIDQDVTEKESKISPGKIVSTGGNVNKKPIPSRQITDTDLYLLGAIEKLVYRVDFMEKRLRRVEEMLYYTVAGNRVDEEPCPNNFTRVKTNCYQFSTSAGREYDWKVASKKCKALGGFLAEMETIEENQDVIAHIQNNQYLRGKDFWVGGLNPGLLWIWSNSARPVKAPDSHNNRENPSASIRGDGRCLRLAYNPGLRSYFYQGTDCSIRYSHICELPEKTSSNEISRLGRSKNIFHDG